jgi:microcystin-dependent protein
MAEPFIGQITLFAGNFAPRGWAFCDGQELSIAQNTALFSILGTTYGGNGQTTFRLPDLRGRVPVHEGQGPGLTNRSLGETGGGEQMQLEVSHMPAHVHPIRATTTTATSTIPTNRVLAAPPGTNIYGTNANTPMAGGMSRPVGGGQHHNNMQPWQCINYIIALEGIFPSRN